MPFPLLNRFYIRNVGVKSKVKYRYNPTVIWKFATVYEVFKWLMHDLRHVCSCMRMSVVGGCMFCVTFPA